MCEAGACLVVTSTRPSRVQDLSALSCDFHPTWPEQTQPSDSTRNHTERLRDLSTLSRDFLPIPLEQTQPSDSTRNHTEPVRDGSTLSRDFHPTRPEQTQPPDSTHNHTDLTGITRHGDSGTTSFLKLRLGNTVSPLTWP